jgi:hypothetical protein
VTDTDKYSIYILLILALVWFVHSAAPYIDAWPEEVVTVKVGQCVNL